MKSNAFLVVFAGLLLPAVQADVNASSSSSHNILPDSFRPPPVFRNVHLMRHTNLEKGYVKETINVVIENIDKSPQDQYYFPFKAEAIGKVGGLEVRDKKEPEKSSFISELVEYDPYR